MNDFEKLGAFYLGKTADAASELVLYDSRDLTTHAMCVGMTGSGKTGLCIGMLEEAAIDGIPAIIVDPKGDMSNLMLSFPELSAQTLRPWINEDEARRHGVDPDTWAGQEADKWRQGIAAYGQTTDRIAMMRQTTEFTIYTPGSLAGRPLSILQLLDEPEAAVLNDAETFNEYVSGIASSFLGLLGIDADPLNSRDHILLSAILSDAWRNHTSLSLELLIERVTKPTFQQVGVMSVDAFYPEKDRFQLALRFNNLLAAPQFDAWRHGEPLDIQNLLYTAAGKPRLSILTIAHLSDQERMFFVTILLNRLLAWVRQQAGTSSLRAMFYMDEIFGYFPPVANPPSKQPLLTLLKQARAYGLGIMLSTQNPVDLDYKGLANMGTWFIGRLQTERDKARLLEGLDSATSGGIDRASVDKMLSALKPRQFFMNNVHDTAPTLFESRFVLSYLAGPLSREQIRSLTADYVEPPVVVAPVTAAPVAEPEPAATPVTPELAGAPQSPIDIKTFYVPSRGVGETVYKPALFGLVDVHFVDAKNGIDYTREEAYATPITDGLVAVDWSQTLDNVVDARSLENTAPSGTYTTLPAAAAQKTAYTKWNRDLQDHVFRVSSLELHRNRGLKALSRPDESERDFVIRMQMESRETRDKELEALRRKYASQLQTLEERLRKQAQAVEREKQQASDAKLQTMISIGSTILSGFLGKKAVSSGTVGKATTAARSASRATRQAGDVTRAEESQESIEARIKELEAALEADLEAVNEKYETKAESLEQFSLKPLKRDVNVKAVTLTWLPYERQGDGSLREAW